jgi:hypothetical protein
MIGLLSLYYNSGRDIPKAHQVLFCSKDTTWQELQSFLYRCVTCPKKDLYSLISPTALSNDLQENFKNLLSE